MSMSFLTKTRAAGSANALNLSPEQILVDESEAAQLSNDMSALRLEISQASSSLDHILSAVDVANGLQEQDVSTPVIAAVFGTQIHAAGVPEELAEEASVGCESAGEEVGNEVLQKAKDIVMDIVNWLITQFKKLKDMARRTFAKNFGSIKRSLDAWRKVKSKAEQMQEDNYTLDDKSKLEVKSGCAYFVLGASNELNPKSVVEWKDIPAKLDTIDKLVTQVSDQLATHKVTDVDGLSALDVTYTSQMKTWTRPAIIGGDSFNAGTGDALHQGVGILGRQVLFHSRRLARDTAPTNGKISEGTAEALSTFKKFVNGMRVGIRPSNVKIRALEEVKLTPPTITEIETLADSYIELLTNALTLETSKKMAKLEKEFDKALASAKKWSKDADTDNAAAKRKAIAGAGLMAAMLSYEQDITLGVVGDVLKYVSSVSKAHGSVMGMAFKVYKKES